MKELEIKIKYFSANNSEGEEVNSHLKIKEIEIGDWIDLFASTGRTIEYRSGEHFLIPLGVAMELPSGYEAHILPRSSTFKKYGILMTNSMGIVDNSYCGNNDQWYFSAYAVKDGMMNDGDRICQFRIVENQPDVKFVEVSELKNPDRNGFGSTGTK